MPLTPEMRRGIDQIRDYLYGGGYPDPLEQRRAARVPVLLLPDRGHRRRQPCSRPRRTGASPTRRSSRASGQLRNPLNAPSKGAETIPRDRFRWSVWAQRHERRAAGALRARRGVPVLRRRSADEFGASFMTGARLVIDEPTVLTQVVGLVERPAASNDADADTKGDLFEHVLRQIKQAGELGQFRTPRHIIRAIVADGRPEAGRDGLRPAAGTAGFLVAAYDHIRLANSSPTGIDEAELDGKPLRRGCGRPAVRPRMATGCATGPSTATTSTRRWSASRP